MPPLTLPAPRRLYPSGPGTVKLGVLDSFRPLPSRVQMAANATAATARKRALIGTKRRTRGGADQNLGWPLDNHC